MPVANSCAPPVPERGDVLPAQLLGDVLKIVGVHEGSGGNGRGGPADGDAVLADEPPLRDGFDGDLVPEPDVLKRGHLAPGMAADFTLMNWNQLQYAGGCNDPVDCIVLSGDARMIETVVVNGETVVKNGRLTKVNEEEKRDYAAAVGRELLTKASARIPGLKADLV